jgi:SpoIID/LytB domain protein
MFCFCQAVTENLKEMKRTILCFLLVCFHSAFAAGPLFQRKIGDLTPVQRGTFLKMRSDWAPVKGSAQPLSLPDRSFRSIWVRMFPLLNVPLGDPYPNTVNLDEVSLYNSKGLNVFGLDDGALLGSAKSVQFDFNASEITFDGATKHLEAVYVVPQGTMTTTAKWDANKVRVELRGGFVVKRSMHEPKDLPPRELWSLINVVDVNDYLMSVVPSEVISGWHAETLRAQAIAARTYGIFETAKARENGRDFDLDPSTWYQSYQGVKMWDPDSSSWRTVELPSTSAAVKATGSKVVTYDGEVIKALFSSNSGGRTCTIRECLEVDYDLPYLVEVDDAPGVRNSPGGTWGTKATLTPANIKAKLKEYGLEFNGSVKKLEHLERGVSGRTWRLRMILADGSKVDLTRFQTRKVMHLFGPIRSFQYELGAMSGGKQSIVGHGYGHASGMSQWGAQLYAKSGWTAARILTHFYSGARVEDLVP